jgi:hypothetical protein
LFLLSLSQNITLSKISNNIKAWDRGFAFKKRNGLKNKTDSKTQHLERRQVLSIFKPSGY